MHVLAQDILGQRFDQRLVERFRIAQPVLGLLVFLDAPGQFDQVAPQFQLGGDLAGQNLEGSRLLSPQLSGGPVVNTQGAEPIPLRRDQGRPCIEPHARVSDHPWMAGEPLLRRRVRHHEKIVLEDGVGAE